MHQVPFVFLLLTANAAVLPGMTPRAFPQAISLGCSDSAISLVKINDRNTVSEESGIGAEFETRDIQFTQQGCSLGNTFEAKRKTVKGHSGANFVLSVDTSVEQGAGTVSAEYVLDGRNIKVGDGSASAAGRAAQADLVSTLLNGPGLKAIDVCRRVGSHGVRIRRTRLSSRTTRSAQLLGPLDDSMKTRIKIRSFGLLKSRHRCP